LWEPINAVGRPVEKRKMTSHLIVFVLATAALAFTPGANTALMVSRTMSNGPAAGAAVLAGVELGFFVHLIATAFGLTALLLAVPAAYEALRIAGAVYLLYVAFRIARTGLVTAPSPGKPAPARRLMQAGFLSNALNPKTAAFYLAIFPQFIDPHQAVLAQIFFLGAVQIAVSTCCNVVYIAAAGRLYEFLRTHPVAERLQRWIFASLIAGFAVNLAYEPRGR
jgi:threonine/homoserine/homoserine lactone efflux protein